MARDFRLIGFAKEMRREPSPAEDRMWRLLRGQRHLPVKFSRQFVIGPFILDFAARAAKLAVELDGESHDSRGVYDERRTEALGTLGYRVIRFTNRDVRDNSDGVLASIRDALRLPLFLAPAAPSLSPQCGERAEKIVPLAGAARLSLPRKAGEG